jgi:hypothetical protein
MAQISKDLQDKLFKFNQAKLDESQLVLLGRAIADVIPIMPADEHELKLYMISQKTIINEIFYSLRSYCYLDDAAQELVFSVSCQFMSWRVALAYKPPYVLFTGDNDKVIDELSLLPSFVNKNLLCSVVSGLQNANYYYSIFRQFSEEIKASLYTS